MYLAFLYSNVYLSTFIKMSKYHLLHMIVDYQMIDIFLCDLRSRFLTHIMLSLPLSSPLSSLFSQSIVGEMTKWLVRFKLPSDSEILKDCKKVEIRIYNNNVFGNVFLHVYVCHVCSISIYLSVYIYIYIYVYIYIHIYRQI